MDFTWGNLLEKEIKQYKLGHIRHVAIRISPSVNSWRSESSNISLVVLNKLLFAPSKYLFTKITKSRTDGTTDSQYLHIKSPRRRQETALGSTHLTKQMFFPCYFQFRLFHFTTFWCHFWGESEFQNTFWGQVIFCFLSMAKFGLYQAVLHLLRWFPAITLLLPTYSFGCFVVGVVILVRLWRY